jgi:hypothetical protein
MKYHTKVINEIQEIIQDLEIANQRTVHAIDAEYSIEDNMIITDYLKEIRGKLHAKLKELDMELFSSMDDGK